MSDEIKLKIFTIANVPTDLAKDWLQHLRDFDSAHPGCHFQVMIDTPDMPMATMIALMQMSPQLDFTAIFPRPETEESELLKCLNSDTCPDCKMSVGFTNGPRGGLSQNIKCNHCGARFNVAPVYPDDRPRRLFFAQRI